MATLPLKTISDLYQKAIRNRGEWVTLRDYDLYVEPSGLILMEHYRNRIFYYDPKGGVYKTVDRFTSSDRDAINSLVMVSGKGRQVYLADGKIYPVGEGPRYKPKKAGRR